MNYHGSGSAANANFPQWSITEQYDGCGVFWKYGVTGDGSNLPYLTYPEPGYS